MDRDSARRVVVGSLITVAVFNLLARGWLAAARQAVKGKAQGGS